MGRAEFGIPAGSLGHDVLGLAYVSAVQLSSVKT